MQCYKRHRVVLQLVPRRTLLKLGLVWVVLLSLQTEFGICSYFEQRGEISGPAWQWLWLLFPITYVEVREKKWYCATEFLSKYILTWMNLIHCMYFTPFPFISSALFHLFSIQCLFNRLLRLYGLRAWPVLWHHCTECGILLKCESVLCAHVFLCATESSCYSPVASITKRAPFVSV